MKRIFFSLTALFVCLMPAAASAGNITATAVTNHTALYTLEYSLGSDDHDVYLPIIAKRTALHDTTLNAMGYTFSVSDDGDTTAGHSTALVLSDAPIENGMYKVPAGSDHTFTLFVLLTLDEADPRAKYGMQLTNFPYYIAEEDGLKTRTLRQGNLKQYDSKEVGLNR